MQLAEFVDGHREVRLYYTEGLGYATYHTDGEMAGRTWFIPTREQAERDFLHSVGYPEWRAAGQAAYEAAREKWLSEHRDLASVGAKNTTP